MILFFISFIYAALLLKKIVKSPDGMLEISEAVLICISSPKFPLLGFKLINFVSILPVDINSFCSPK